MKFLFLAGIGQSLGELTPVDQPSEYWTRGTDDSSYPSRHRGPLGANTLPNLDAGERWNETIWDTAHNYDSTNSYAYNYWPWLVPTMSVGGSEMEPSDFYIFTYKYSGIEGLNSLNSAVVADLPAYNKLYAWMHRISNAKLNDLEEGTEWWLYDSCDGPTCGQDRMGDRTTVATTTTAATNSTVDVSEACDEAQKALAAEKNELAKIPLQLACEQACVNDAGATCKETVTVSAACDEAQKALSAEEHSLAKIPLKLACEQACVDDPEATCGFLVNGLSMLLIAVLAMLK